MGGHITFHHNQPYYEKATKWAIEDWNEITRNCQVRNTNTIDRYELILYQVDMNYAYKEEGIHLVPYPAQFAVPLFPKKIKENCLSELKDRYDNVSDDTIENS